jgi:hypothetical protein
MCLRVRIIGVRRLTEDEMAFLQLKLALQALAQPAEIQATLFPDWVAVPDELALDFDNCYHATILRDQLTDAQRLRLAAVDRLLGSMSDGNSSETWGRAALVSSSQWRTVRELAIEALRSMNWELDKPTSGRSQHFRAR